METSTATLGHPTTAPATRPKRGAASGSRVGKLSVPTGRALRTGLRLAQQFAILWLLFGVGTALVRVLSLPLPGNLVGMLLLLLLLSVGVIRPEHIGDLSALIVRHFAFFFIPFAVGVMTWSELLATSGLILGISLLGSAVVGLVTAGFVAQTLARGGRSDVS